MVEAAGASAVAVHGRTRQQKGNAPGPADWAAIRAVKAALRAHAGAVLAPHKLPAVVNLVAAIEVGGALKKRRTGP